MTTEEEIQEVINNKAEGVLINGDCLEVLKLIPDLSIDLVTTDPPYLIDYKTGRRKNKNHKFCSPIAGDSDPALIVACLKELYRVMKPNSALYMFLSSAKLAFFIDEIAKLFKIKNTIVWIKNNWTAGDLKGAYEKQYEMCIYAAKGAPRIRGKRLTDVWHFNRVAGKELVHQNQKPLSMIQQIIEKSSDEGQLVLDPFVGSGTLAVAASNLKRRYIGIEKDIEYFLIACGRAGISAA